MSDERPPDELIELPLSHKESWDEVEKGGSRVPAGRGGGPAPRRVRQGRHTGPAGRRRWPLALALLGAALVGYWLLRPAPPRVEFASPSLAFAERLAGTSSEPQVVILTNGGERPLRIASVGVVGAPEADFVTDSEDCSGSELAELGECRIGVRFAPRAPGARTGELAVVGNMPGERALLPLLGEAVAPQVVARPELLDFGAESVGGASPGRDLELVNAGSSVLSIASVSVASSSREFRLIGNECSAKRLEPAQSCKVRLVFQPALLGERVAELAVDSDSFGASQPIRLVGSGSGPDLRAEPPGLTFPDQLVGTRSAAAKLALTNRGDAVFRINRVWIAAGAPFSIVRQNCSGAAVEPQRSCSVEVVFAPRAEGRVEASLEIRESSGGMAPGVGVSGRGVAPRLELSSRTLDFGAALPGETLADRQLTLTNAGSAPLAIAGLRVAGDDAAAFSTTRDSCSGAQLAPGKRCEVAIGFAPRRGGAHAARLTVDSGQRGDAAVELRGHARAPRLDLDRQRLDFAAVRQSESQDLRVEVSNGGDAPLEIGAARAGGAAATDFAVAVDACSRRQLAPGASCQLVVRFTPTANGPRDGRLILETSAAAGEVSLVLRGVGEEPPEARIEVAPLSLEFAGLPAGERSEVATVRIASVGQGRLQLSQVRVGGRDAADFRIVPGTCQGLSYVVPGADCTVGVRFTPTAAGQRLAALIITHNARQGPVEVRLGGEGY